MTPDRTHITDRKSVVPSRMLRISVDGPRIRQVIATVRPMVINGFGLSVTMVAFDLPVPDRHGPYGPAAPNKGHGIDTTVAALTRSRAKEGPPCQP